MLASDLPITVRVAAQTGAPASVLGREAIRYLIASAVALTLDFCVLWTAVHAAALPIWLAGGFGYLAGLALIYGLSVKWVFGHRQIRDRRSEFVIFALLGGVGLGLNSVALSIATAFGATLFAAKLASAAIGFSVNFALRKLVLFTGSRA